MKFDSLPDGSQLPPTPEIKECFDHEKLDVLSRAYLHNWVVTEVTRTEMVKFASVGF